VSEQTSLFGDPAESGAPTADLAPLDGMTRDAVLSPCGTYRYRLTRLWDETLPMLGWIMLNPSTADASVDDPTIRKCIGFAKRGGFGSIVVTNLFAFRATDPKELKRRAPRKRAAKGERARDMSEIVGPNNDAHILAAVHEALRTVCAWGSHGAFGGRDRDVLLMLKREGVFDGWDRGWITRLDVTQDGDPRHPLYLKYELIDAIVADLARHDRGVRR
jgi:hypothetical protein